MKTLSIPEVAAFLLQGDRYVILTHRRPDGDTIGCAAALCGGLRQLGKQAAILENVSRYVKPGGVMVYSTCTVLKRENENVANAFLARHPEFRLEVFALPAGLDAQTDGMLTLYPHLHEADGFFICKLRKNV